MTKAEILKQLKELQEQVIMLTEDDVKSIRTLPIGGEIFTYINSMNCSYQDSTYPISFDNSPIKDHLRIGNYFKSKEDAEMVVRAMQIEQAIRIRRIELNDGWEPDFEDIDDYSKYFIFTNIFTNPGCLYISTTNYANSYPIFGFYKTEEIAQQIIDEFKDDLLWYFKEYYPNKDKMYMWGEIEND